MIPTQRKTPTLPPRIWSHLLGHVGRAVGILWLSSMLLVGKQLADVAGLSPHLIQATTPACALASSGSCDNQDPYGSNESCGSTDGAVMARRAWTSQQNGHTPMETELFWSPSCQTWWAETFIPKQRPRTLFIATWVRLCSPDGPCWEKRASGASSDLWTRMLASRPGVIWACGAPDAQWIKRAESCTDPIPVSDPQGRPSQGS